MPFHGGRIFSGFEDFYRQLLDRAFAVETASACIPCNTILSTIALPELDQILPEQTHSLDNNFQKIKYIGIVCVLFNLKTSFSKSYWMNINDSRISFNGIIEQTNLNRIWRDSGLYIIYIPNYLPSSDPRFSYSETKLVNEYVDMLKFINPDFDHTWIKDFYISRAPFAQAICQTQFIDLMQGVRSAIPGLYITDSSQFYPEDRTISASIRQGRITAELIIEDFQRH